MVKNKKKARAGAGKAHRRPAAKSSRKTGKKPVRKSGARKAKRPARKTPKGTKKAVRAAKAVKKAAPAPRASRPARKSPSASGELFGEGNWKADEQYREGLRKFAQTHDVPALAREAARGLPPDLRESEDSDVKESARRGAEEEPEW